MPNPRANRPLTLDQVTADLKSLSQPAQALFDMMAGGLRGSAVGTLGAPGDIETLARMGVNAAGGSFNPAMPSRSGRPFQPISEEPYFPSSEELAKRFAPTIPNGDVMRQKSAEPFEEVGQFAPLPGSARVTKGALNAVKSIPAALKHGALEFAKASAMGAPHVVKPNASISRVFEPNPDWKTNTVNFGKPTPGIMIPSKMSNVREAVRELKGNYGARRVERAADEIPNLERMYQEDALKEAFTGDNASAMITLNPAEFERYARELKGRTKADIGPKMAELARQGVIDKYTVPMDEYIKHLQRLQGGFRDVPNLNLFKDEVGLPTMPKVTGHEGRHRSRALAEQEAPTSLVQIIPGGDLREGLPRRTQEEFIEALKEELGRSNQLVLPESDGLYKRPAVEFPQPYAEGGSVYISDNPETMKMELGDKHMRKGGSEDDTKPFVGYPHLAKQARYARAVTPESGDVNLLKDPQTYAYVMGLLGEAPDELGFTALNSDELKQKIKAAGEKGFVTGAVSQIGPVAQLAKKAGKKALNVTGQALSDAMIHQTGPLSQGPLSMLAPKAAVSHVVKPKGGNWLTGSVEKVIDPLKTKYGVMTPEEIRSHQQAIETAKRIHANSADPAYQNAIAQMENEARSSTHANAINQWIDRNLTNYIKKEMATPEDPVRKLGEQGIETQGRFQYPENKVPFHLEMRRDRFGYPEQGLSQSQTAKNWENIADETIADETAADIIKIANSSDAIKRQKYQAILKENPWIFKVDPNTRIFSPSFGNWTYGDTGFDHIVDVLREDLATGRIRPEQLSKVSMEQAVRRTYEYDQELAKKMAEARVAARADLPVHKEYPEGYKWVELNKPGSFAQESDMMGHSVRGYEPPQGHPDWMHLSAKSGSPTYGHGGWEAIKSGKAKVYSLVDPQGMSQATVEIGRTEHPIGYSYRGNEPDNFPKTFEYNRDFSGDFPRLTPEQHAQIYNRAKEIWFSGHDPKMQDRMDAFQAAAHEILGSPPAEITQIKGKSNSAPSREYLPYVQDFVRGGQWSDVRDLQNTGLIKFKNNQYITESEAKEAFAPRINQALEFLQTHPAFEEQRAARAKRDKDLLNFDYDQDRELEKIYGAPLFPKSYYNATELINVLKSPEDHISGLQDLYPSLNRWLEEAEKGMEHFAYKPPPEGMKRGGVVISDNPDTMMMELGDQHFALGGVTDVLKMVKANRARKMAQKAEEELALPSKLPRAKPRSKEELRPLAQEMAEATRGDFYRPDPSKSINPAGKSFEQWKAEQQLTHDIRPTAKHKAIPRADIEKQKGMVKMGISGDTTAAEKVLHEAGPYALDIPSPQHGGALYGLGGEGAWASNNPIAANVQKRINEIFEAYGGLPVLGQYMQMGKLGSNFALHFADANLRAIDLSKMSKNQIEMVNELIRSGSKKSGPRPSFPGIEDKDSAYLHFAVDPELRKHFNAIMQKPTYTEPLGLPDGRIIHHAITEPELTNLPVTTTGFSQMELVPGFDPKKLLLSEHPTYSHVIPNRPGSQLTRTQYHTPAQVEFPDVYEYITETGPKKYRPEDATRMFQTATPRQIIDQQHIDEIKMFEELMKEYGGKKKGGAIHVKKKSDLKHGRVIPLGKAKEVDISQLVPQMSAGGKLSKAALEAFERMKAMRPEIAAKASLEQKALLENANKYARDIQPFSMTPEEVSAEMKRLESKGLAGGGEVNADDLILEERPL